MMEIERPKIETASLSPDGRYGKFVAEPLERGFGITLGNSLRRVLLSSLPGVAVTSVKIDGVVHEFSTIAGVKEDVAEVILNLKELVVSSEQDEPVLMYLRKQGPCEVTAADITPPAGVEIHNPDLHIATLNEKGKLIGDFTPNTPKYVFKGIAEFAAYPPEIITGDNYEERAQALGDLLSPVTINIFNISKINSEVRGGKDQRQQEDPHHTPTSGPAQGRGPPSREDSRISQPPPSPM